MHHRGHSLVCDAFIRGPVRLSSITLTPQGGFFLGCVAVGVYSTRRRGEEGAGAAHIYYTHVMNPSRSVWGLFGFRGRSRKEVVHIGY